VRNSHHWPKILKKRTRPYQRAKQPAETKRRIENRESVERGKELGKTASVLEAKKAICVARSKL